MLSLTRRPWGTCLLGLAALAFTGPAVRGQMTPRQMNNLATFGRMNFGLNPLAGLGIYGGAGLSGGSLASLYANPNGTGALANNAYGGTSGQNPYGTYYEDPFGAFLRGGASVIDSQGRLMVNQQQAFLLREQVRGDRAASDRKIFDEYVYERQKTPTAEEERRRLQSQAVQRARNNPPVTEIWSGRALNDILKDLQKQPLGRDSASLRISPLSLDEDGLKHINVTKGTGNIGLLKNEGRLHWPVALTGSDYAEQRERLSALAQEAVRQAEFNSRVDAATTRQMAAGVDKLRDQLRRKGRDLSAAEYIEAKSFVNDFDDAITALRQEDVGNHFAGRYVLKATTIAELIKYMTEHGLQFAPALPGDRAAYAVLHQALANYGRSPAVQTAAR